MPSIRRRLRCVQAVSVVTAAIILTGALAGAQGPAQAQVPPSATAPQPAVDLLSPQALQVLVAGVALYPDPVIEQVLAAAQDPVSLHQGAQQLSPATTNEVDQLLRANLSESVRYLQQYPELLRQLDAQLPQTARLGVAAKTQTQDVWNAIDAVRAQAEPAASAEPAAAAPSSGDAASSAGSSGFAYPVPVGVIHPGWLAPLIINEAREAHAGQVNITANGQFNRQGTATVNQFGRQQAGSAIGNFQRGTAAPQRPTLTTPGSRSPQVRSGDGPRPSPGGRGGRGGRR